jgi:hypothetical protein
MAKNDTLDRNFDDDTSGGTSTKGSTAGVKQRLSGLGDRASTQIDNSPLAALGAGLALGAVLGASLPVSRKERELLEPYGKKLSEAGTNAIDRSREVAKQKFDEMAGDKVREFLGSSSSSSGSSTGSTTA